MQKFLQILIGICTLTGLIWGGLWAFSGKIATAEDVKQLEQKTLATFEQFQKGIDKKFDQQQLTLLMDRKYRIREELRRNPQDPFVKDDYREIQIKIETIEKQLKEKEK